jgi:acyl carrier protein
VSDPQLDLTVRAVVAEQMHRPPDDLTGDLDLRADLGLDDACEAILLSAMGEALDAIFPDDFLDGVHTYADLTTAVRVSLGP